jgi:hypothetical protein
MVATLAKRWSARSNEAARVIEHPPPKISDPQHPRKALCLIEPFEGSDEKIGTRLGAFHGVIVAINNRKLLILLAQETV